MHQSSRFRSVQERWVSFCFDFLCLGLAQFISLGTEGEDLGEKLETCGLDNWISVKGTKFSFPLNLFPIFNTDFFLGFYASVVFLLDYAP